MTVNIEDLKQLRYRAIEKLVKRLRDEGLSALDLAQLDSKILNYNTLVQMTQDDFICRKCGQGPLDVNTVNHNNNWVCPECKIAQYRPGVKRLDRS